MRKHRSSSFALRSRQGFLVILVLAILSLFGTLGVCQVLVHASAGLSSRALEHRRQRLTISYRAQRALGEALLSFCESGPGGPDSLEDRIAERLVELDAGMAKVLLESCPTAIPTPVMFPNSAKEPDPLAPPSLEMQVMASPELRRMMSARVAEYTVGRSRFVCEAPVMGKPLRFSLEYEGRLVAVPLTAIAKMAYDLPHEIGDRTLDTGLVEASSSLGLVPMRDLASVGTMQSMEDALPYHYRRKASVAGAYRDLFSQAYVNRLALFAGPAHILDLDQLETDIPRLDGYSRSADEAVLDLGVVGRGRWGSIESVSSVLMVSSGKPGLVLKIRDSAPAVKGQPMVLVLMGTKETPFSVELSTIARPVILIGFNLNLSTPSQVFLNGALFLDPRCSLTANSGALHVAHFSFAAAAAGVQEASVVADLPLNPVLENMAPRVVHVAVVPVAL